MGGKTAAPGRGPPAEGGSGPSRSRASPSVAFRDPTMAGGAGATSGSSPTPTPSSRAFVPAKQQPKDESTGSGANGVSSQLSDARPSVTPPVSSVRGGKSGGRGRRSKELNRAPPSATSPNAQDASLLPPQPSRTVAAAKDVQRSGAPMVTPPGTPPAKPQALPPGMQFKSAVTDLQSGDEYIAGSVVHYVQKGSGAPASRSPDTRARAGVGGGMEGGAAVDNGSPPRLAASHVASPDRQLPPSFKPPSPAPEELDEALREHGSPSLDSIRGALIAGMNRPLRSPHAGPSQRILRWKTATGEVQAGVDNQIAGIVRSLRGFAEGSREARQFHARFSHFPTFHPDTPVGGMLIVVGMLLGSAGLAYVFHEVKLFFSDPANLSLAPVLAAYRGFVGPSMTLTDFTLHLAPLLYVALAPLGCAFATLFSCPSPEPKPIGTGMGRRVQRRIAKGFHAVSAATRMQRSSLGSMV